MTSAKQPVRTWLVLSYALISIAAFAATWSQNLAYFGGDGGSQAFSTFWLETKVNPASRSITVDIGFFLLAAAIFMVIEARRLAVPFVWLYILGGFLVAISVAFPLFMIAREHRLGSVDRSGTDWKLTATDIIGLLIVAAVIIGFSVFLLT